MSRKTLSAAALAVLVLVGGFGLLTGRVSVGELASGDVSIEQIASDLLGDSSSPSSSEGSSSGISTQAASGASQVGGAPEISTEAARGKLAEMQVSPAGSMTGYSRDDFDHWEDAEEYGWSIPSYVQDSGSCDARDATLIRDGSNVEVGEYCDVGSGRWADPLTGQSLTDPSDVDIDHVVPLANAYRSGAASWSEEKKAEYANAPVVLAATDDGENQSKGDKGPEAYRPPYEGSHCSYAKRWVQIKDQWSLSVTSAEKSALEGMLAGCGT